MVIPRADATPHSVETPTATPVAAWRLTEAREASARR